MNVEIGSGRILNNRFMTNSRSQMFAFPRLLDLLLFRITVPAQSDLIYWMEEANPICFCSCGMTIPGHGVLEHLRLLVPKDGRLKFSGQVSLLAC